MKYTLIKESRNNEDNYGSRVEYQFEGLTLSDMLEHYQNFLKGCGYIFEGELDIVTDEYGGEGND